MVISSVRPQGCGLDTEGMAIIEQRLPIICRFILQFAMEPIDSLDIKTLLPSIDRVLPQVSECQWHELGVQLGFLEDSLWRLTHRRWKVGTFSVPAPARLGHLTPR